MGHHTPRTPLLLALALLSLLAFSPAASADQVICGGGPGAGQCESPQGIAVDTSSAEPESGRVYIADTQNNRVDVFDESGAFLFAFGWKVNATTPEEKLQVCTIASGCLKGTAGAGAGQLSSPEKIAVDSSSHDVYVSEGVVGLRVQKFDFEGHFVWMFGGEVDQVTHANLCTVAANCGAGKEAEKAAGKEEGRFFGTLGLGLQVSVGPGGNLYVADSRLIGTAESEGFETRIQRLEPSGTYIGPQLILPDKVGRVQAFAVDSGGGIYSASARFFEGTEGLVSGVYKYDFSGAKITSWGENGKVDTTAAAIPAIALDPAGDLFVADGVPSSAPTQITEFSPSGVKNRVFFGNGTLKSTSTPTALAFHHTATGDLYAAENFFGGPEEHPRVVQLALPPPGPLLVPGSTEASPVGNVRATLKVSFNSEGKASKAHFQYISKQKYIDDGNSFGVGTQTTPDSASTPADFENHTAAATNACVVPTEPSCLEPETTYYFRAFASNADGTVESEDKAEFTTKPPLEIDATWATEVGTDTARLHAEVNPLGIGATAYFQYIPEGPDYQAHGFEHAISIPQPAHPFDFGSGEAPAVAATQLYPLDPGTTYHYRLIAEDPYFPAVTSPERTFATFALPGQGEEGCENQVFRTGASAALPDCRAYEMVSPLDKNNGDIRTLLNPFSYMTYLDQSSAEGSGFTYSSYRAFANPQSAPYTNQYLANRGEDGWQNKSIDPQGKGSELLENPYKAFSADLSSAWLSWRSAAGEPAPDPCAPVGVTQLYRRESSSGAFGSLSCVQPSLETLEFLPEIQGFSADGAHSVFRADSALTANASAATTVNPSLRPIYQLYESTGAGQLRLISVLPSGEAAGSDSSAGTVGERNSVASWFFNRIGSLDHAVSEDGTRVFWSAATSGVLGPLYLRTNADQAQSKVEEGECKQPAKACTIPVSGAVTTQPVRFQTANPQGTKALFNVEENGPLKDDLYEFDAEAEPPASQLIATKVMQSILGASDDLSRIYFASEEATATQQAEGAVKGQPNVYLYEEGTTRFVAALSNPDVSFGVGHEYGTPISAQPIYHDARVSAGGESLVFMSDSLALSERVAGYDNTDAQTGKADAEVYVYDATADEGNGKLRCISCNPSGSRPMGREVILYPGNSPTPLAARVPLFETQLYQPRYLSDDGKRVFFDSYEGLVLSDTNGKQDVYQWEAPGTGKCKTDSPTYVSDSTGCLSLLSSGQSPGDSEFLDASASGSDAFFTTSEGLLPQDYGLIDVYDARVNGGFPPPQGPPTACEGEACQSPREAPNDPTPASAAFEGAGNLNETGKGRCAKGKARRKGRCVAKKQKAKKHHKRAHHNRRTQR